MLVGLFVRGIKVYSNINFIPFLALNGDYPVIEHNFVSYIGANGSGKSSILEALDCFFNVKSYNVNKGVTTSDCKKENNKFPFVVPIFLLDKSKTKVKDNELLNEFSEYLWNIDKISKEWIDFLNIRNKLKLLGFRNNYHLFIGGERLDENKTRQVYFPPFVDKFQVNLSNINIIGEIKEAYSYVYLPVEAEVESFTKLETNEMQKLIGKTLKDKIGAVLKDSTKINQINKNLDDFLDTLKQSFETFEKNELYQYKSISPRKHNITKTHLIDKIIEAYFETKVLYRGNKRVSELSAGEKRQALIAVATAFLQESGEIDKNVIVAVDEPESSLHASLCYEQFEKLHKISSMAQVLITTHWYGFLPIIDYGHAHFLNKDNDNNKVSFESYALYNYKTQVKNSIEQSHNKTPVDFHLKSHYDLVQSIYHSLAAKNPYNWLLVEGITDKMYLEFFLTKETLLELNLKILPLGSFKHVKQIFEFLKLPLEEFVRDSKGRVFCLIDTDNPKLEIIDDNDLPNLVFRRLCHNETSDTVSLLKINRGNTAKTDIEQCLNPIIFKQTYDTFNNQEYYKEIKIKNEKGNTNFAKNLNAINELSDFFGSNKNKFSFCEKYIEIFKSQENYKDFVPAWVNLIENFLRYGNKP